MKTIQIGGGIILVAFSLFISFGIIASGLKEGDEDIVKYLTVPVLTIVIGIYLIGRGKNFKIQFKLEIPYIKPLCVTK